MSPPASKINKLRFADLAVLFVLAGLVTIYGVDSVRSSTQILNLIFVLPVTGIVLLLCIVRFVFELRDRKNETPKRDSVVEIAPVMALFAAYVISLNWLGFDVGTSLFVAAFLWLRGERRWSWLIGYSIALGFGLTLFFSAMLPYPMPMLVLATAH